MRKKKVAIFAVMLCHAAGTWETLSYMNDGETTVNRLEFAGENGIMPGSQSRPGNHKKGF